MAEFSKLYLTKKGQALMAKIIAGQATISFTKVSTSSKVYAESALENLTALEQVQQTNNVTKVTITNATAVKVETAFTNEKLMAGYYLRSLGLYARDPDVGEILYAVCVETSGLCYMPAYNGVTVSSAYIQLYTTVGNSDDVDITIYSGAYATVEDIEALENKIADLQTFVGYTDSHIYGVEVDFTNKKFTRLAGAFGKAGGTPFDSVHCFGGRRRCNLTDDGKVVAYYGDAAFTTTGALTQAVEIESGKNEGTYPVGTKVQVMVEQPKFYYKVVPLELEQITEGENNGYHTRKVRYYVCDEPETGFKLHPAFIENGKENDFIYLAAFEGSLWDASASAYILDDAQVASFTAAVGTGDMLSSVANAKPMSGLTQNLTRKNTRIIAENRGSGWEQSYAATVAASQMLMLIEYATFNMQSAIGKGAVSKTDDGTTSMTEVTGATVNLGNDSGVVTNANGIQIVSYRGEENFWGNLWTWVDGMNEHNPSTWTQTSASDGEYGRLYVADHGFVDDTDASPYEDTGICPCYSSGGYISAFGYSEEFDWLFVPTEKAGNSSLPVSDYFWNYNANWRVARLGGSWNYDSTAGAFCWSLTYASSYRYRSFGGRLVYVPSKAAA